MDVAWWGSDGWESIADRGRLPPRAKSIAGVAGSHRVLVHRVVVTWWS
jgi:hypothetical protein